MSLHALTHAKAPWTHLLAATPSDACDALGGLESSAANRLVARLIRGRKSTTREAFFDESAAALQFPYYFGENWDAFHDCLGDLAWLHAATVVVGLLDADRLLAAGPPESAKHLATVLQEVAARRNRPAGKKAARPFHVVFQAVPAVAEEVARRWQALGLSLGRLGG